MRTLHGYLTRQVLASLLLTVAVFTGVLLLGNLLKEVLHLLMSKQVTMMVLIKAVLLLVPFALVFSLPMGMLTATLLVFGRFSADQELTAARANGISLLSLVTPIVFLSAALCALSAWINTSIAPRCRIAYKELALQALAERPQSLLSEGSLVTLKNYRIHIGGTVGEDFEDVQISEVKEGRTIQKIYAERLRVSPDVANRRAYFTVFGAQISRLDGDQWQTSSAEEYQLPPIDLSESKTGAYEPKLTEMSFDQLTEKIRAWRAEGVDVTPALVQLHRQVAFSFACIGFTLVGIPLGIRAHRRETSVGVAVAVVLVLVYYAFIILGQALETKAQYHPWVIVWVPNFLFQGIGGFLLWRANRGG